MGLMLFSLWGMLSRQVLLGVLLVAPIATLGVSAGSSCQSLGGFTGLEDLLFCQGKHTFRNWWPALGSGSGLRLSSGIGCST